MSEHDNTGQNETATLAEGASATTPSERGETGFFVAREGVATGEMVTLTPEQVAARKRRNVAIGLSLLGFCALVFVVTVVKLGQNFAQGAAS